MITGYLSSTTNRQVPNMIDLIGWFLILQSILVNSPSIEVVIDSNEVYGKATCYNGIPVIYQSLEPNMSTVVHEYLHAYDCLDNGYMDGSPLPVEYLGTTKDPAHLWVYWAMSNPTEATTITSSFHHP